MKNKIWLIHFKECDYDEYDGFVVVAPDKKRVFEIVKLAHTGCCGGNITEDNIGFITEISAEKEAVILGSFNAG